MSVVDNLYRDIPAHSDAEIFTDLLQRPGVRIERIISDGQVSPPDFWYQQQQCEWVLLLQGEARILFQHPEREVLLTAGSYLTIEPMQRHRVTYTAPGTIWLAVWIDL
ncbi:MAG: cupin [Enterobacteriaceae bacterium]